MSSFDHDPIETLSFSQRAQRELVEELRAHKSENNRSGRGVRVGFTAERIIVSIVNPGGNMVKYSVVPRDLSRRGFAFLHGRFVYPDSKCQIILPALDGECMTIEGTIVRCRHLSGTVHEVAAAFNPPIDLGLFAKMTRSEQISHEDEYRCDVEDGTIEQGPRKLGDVLLVDSYPLDLKLYSTLLGSIGLHCRGFASEADAIGAVDLSKFDAAMIDVCTNPPSGLQAISNLREGGLAGPILAVSVDDDEATRDAAIQAGANAFLPKPLEYKVIKEQFGQLLGLEPMDASASDPIISTFNDDESMRPLLREFVANARELIGTLKSVSDAHDIDQMRQVCRQLKGAGGGYGFVEVTQTAQSVLDTINAAHDDAKAVQEVVNGLLDVLSRVRAA